MSTTKKILQKVLAKSIEAQKANMPFTVVFDLDSTLFCVSSRNAEILNHLADDTELNQKFPHYTPLIRNLEVTPKDWGIRTILARAKVVGTIDFFEMVRLKWADAFFSSTHLHHDEPYPGAVEYVQALKNANADIHYLTGRDWPRMGQGTLASLKHWQFPLISEAHLHMKPDSNRHDAEYKLDVLKQLVKVNADICFFENEPVIINLVHKYLPNLPIVFINSIHSGRETTQEGLPSIEPDFRH